ncbi:NO-inducible flavohemoprotein [Alkalibacillus silvisoli]|uniref:Flavohemoprotein n=1 Tax=Alkalibacillus silvisoli TaxID=392823 RepID=A0ABP3JFZ3_9BACI
MLKEQQIQIIKSTAPVLREYGTQITTRFYNLLFENHPELLNIFNQANQKQGKQQQALANSIIAAAENIEQLEEIIPVVEKIAHKHRSIGVKPEHYPIVGENLLQTIADVLKENATEEILNSWKEAYNVIADIFIDLEANMYEQAENQNGGWSNFKDFYIAKKVKESDVITSFYLKPADEEPLPSFNPGQYISLKISIPEETYTHVRQYSLSNSPGEAHFRISVKRESDDEPNGIASNYLHDSLNIGDLIPVSAPAGDFTLDLTNHRPLVLIGGGVGVTPMMSMLHTVTKEHPNRPVTFIHAAKNSKIQAFKAEVENTLLNNNHLNVLTVYSEATEQDQSENNFTEEGYISYSWLKQNIRNLNSDFYFCGPKPFMQNVMHALLELGASPEQINYEFFGPKEDLPQPTTV